MVRWLRLRYRGEAKIDAEDHSTIEAVIERDRDGRVRETRMFFGADGVRVEESRRGGDKPPKKKVRNIEAGPAVLDPLSFLFMARGVDWQVGVADRFEVLSGEDRWMVDLNCIDRIRLEIAGALREAWVVIPTLEKIGEDGEESGEPFVRELALFLSTDSAREILKIRTRTKVGTARLRLERFSPEPIGKD